MTLVRLRKEEKEVKFLQSLGSNTSLTQNWCLMTICSYFSCFHLHLKPNSPWLFHTSPPSRLLGVTVCDNTITFPRCPRYPKPLLVVMTQFNETNDPKSLGIIDTENTGEGGGICWFWWEEQSQPRRNQICWKSRASHHGKQNKVWRGRGCLIMSKAIKRLLNLVIKALLLTLKSAGSLKHCIKMWG